MARLESGERHVELSWWVVQGAGPPFIFRDHHDCGCPTLAFFARVGTPDSDLVDTNLALRSVPAHPFAQNAKGWAPRSGISFQRQEITDAGIGTV